GAAPQQEVLPDGELWHHDGTEHACGSPDRLPLGLLLGFTPGLPDGARTRQDLPRPAARGPCHVDAAGSPRRVRVALHLGRPRARPAGHGPASARAPRRAGQGGGRSPVGDGARTRRAHSLEVGGTRYYALTEMARKPAVLVTGANGEIGHGLIHRLADLGTFDILALDVRPLETDLARRCAATVVGDVLDRHLLDRAMGEFEISVIFHLAAILSTRAEFVPETAHEVNVQGTLNL